MTFSLMFPMTSCVPGLFAKLAAERGYDATNREILPLTDIHLKSSIGNLRYIIQEAGISLELYFCRCLEQASSATKPDLLISLNLWP
ncbi:hypothetical protein F4821DRAFT_250293 [Hypoxylon rubiginosum]|uniref:Uncharacterized protein n=1 Tax=Hypoxylon rubiginosum TaxID=110542 RepID=A0ACC0CKS2_9PEZI|nr:hypothetical protein F4821DRAFT_250293 [Hypoxylon rubiginosum]